MLGQRLHAILVSLCQSSRGRGPHRLLRARRGGVVLTDTMYQVRGPDGERHACRPCMERCRFRRHDEDEDGECTNADEF
jgi:hypothetical protein